MKYHTLTDKIYFEGNKEDVLKPKVMTDQIIREYLKGKVDTINNAEGLYELFELTQEQTLCPNCGGKIEIRNPTGRCDHLYYPENVPKTLSEPLKPIEPIYTETDDKLGWVAERLNEVIERINILSEEHNYDQKTS